MTRNLQLHLEDNWRLQYSSSFPAISLGTNSQGNPIYQPITEIIIPTIFDKSIIAVSINTTVPVGRIWKYAGYLSYSLITGLGASFVGERQRLFLGKFNLVFFDDLNVNYFVSIQVPQWFIDANVAIYQYEGTDTSKVDDDLARIESKIDFLNQILGD
jgi:hypothetical protein